MSIMEYIFDTILLYSLLYLWVRLFSMGSKLLSISNIRNKHISRQNSTHVIMFHQTMHIHITWWSFTRCQHHLEAICDPAACWFFIWGCHYFLKEFCGSAYTWQVTKQIIVEKTEVSMYQFECIFCICTQFQFLVSHYPCLYHIKIGKNVQYLYLA